MQKPGEGGRFREARTGAIVQVRGDDGLDKNRCSRGRMRGGWILYMFWRRS